jgi:hypothetical protein
MRVFLVVFEGESLAWMFCAHDGGHTKSKQNAKMDSRGVETLNKLSLNALELVYDLTAMP